MNDTLEFNRVTFGLPIESFRIEAYIALEERLPVVTEYVLRLIRICNAVPLDVLRDYFGFSESEMLAVTESLIRQGLLLIEDDHARLSRFAREKFDAVGDEHPRFSRVELRPDTVHFDLISYTPLRSGRGSLTNNIIKLEAPEESLGRSIERARDAYSQRYAEIASMRGGDLREKSFGVYAVVDVESKNRTYIPIPISFGIDQDGQVQRLFDEAFERLIPPDLLHSINVQVTAEIARIRTSGGTALQTFVDFFEDPVLPRYLTGEKFDLLGYVSDVYLTQSEKYPEGMEPVFGNLYLPSNRERIFARLRDSQSGQGNQGKRLTANVIWLAPHYSLWGRGRAYEETVRQLTVELRQTQNDLSRVFYARPGEESYLRSMYRIQDVREPYFSKVALEDTHLTDGRLEILLCPDVFAFVLLHVPLSGNMGLWAPVGFATTISKHLEFLSDLCSVLTSLTP